MTTLNNTIKRLNNSITLKIPIIVETHQQSVKNLIQTLIEENTVTLVETFDCSCTINPTKTLKSIHSTKLESIKYKNIVKKAKETIKSGYLLISTPKGVMSHKKALKHRLGGIIIGIVKY